MNIITKKVTLAWRNPYVLDGLVWIWSLNQRIPLDNAANEGAATIKFLFNNMSDFTVDVAFSANDLSADSYPRIYCTDWNSIHISPRNTGTAENPSQRPRLYANQKADYSSTYDNRRLALAVGTSSYLQCFGRDRFWTVSTPERIPTSSEFTITDSSNPGYHFAAIRIYNRLLSRDELIVNYAADAVEFEW